MTNRILTLCLGLLALTLVAGCGSSSSVQRVDADTQTDLSGRWNDTDARLVAEEMIGDVLSRPWLRQHRADHGEQPVVIVGPVENRTMEHIDTEVFTKDLERELINSGQVTFVAAEHERQAIRRERSDQQQYASFETASEMAQEIGADFMLLGSITSVVDEALDGGQVAIFYTVNLELINIEQNTKAWIGNKKIKKIVERGRYRR